MIPPATALETNHTTQWFRRPKTWVVLAGILLRRADRPVVIWSGACSTGEEAYSAAILLDMIQVAGRVLAADVDRDVVAHARAGRYHVGVQGAGDIQGLDLTPWLERDSPGYAKVHAGIASKVDFSVRDLREPAAVPARCDVAIVRNVWRYLSPDEQAGLAHRIAASLTPGGVLVLGGSDKTLPGMIPPSAVAQLFVEGTGGIWQRKE